MDQMMIFNPLPRKFMGEPGIKYDVKSVYESHDALKSFLVEWYHQVVGLKDDTPKWELNVITNTRHTYTLEGIELSRIIYDNQDKTKKRSEYKLKIDLGQGDRPSKGISISNFASSTYTESEFLRFTFNRVSILEQLLLQLCLTGRMDLIRKTTEYKIEMDHLKMHPDLVMEWTAPEAEPMFVVDSWSGDMAGTIKGMTCNSYLRKKVALDYLQKESES